MQLAYRVRLTRPARHPGGGDDYTRGGTANRRMTGHNERVNVKWRSTARGWLRGAVAFARTAEPRSAVSRQAVTGDVALAAGFVLVSLIAVAAKVSHSSGAALELIPGLPGRSDPIPVEVAGPLTGLGAAAIAAAVATSVPLGARRVLPLTTFWLILGATAATSSYATLATFVAITFAAYNAVVRSRFRGGVLLSLPLAALAVMAMFPNSAPPLPARASPLFIFIPILIVGNAVHVWRRRAGDSQDRLRRLAAEHEAATRHALEVERSRIASELHDVVTHNVSVMVVQAGAARRVLDAAPDDARDAMLAVESSGRAAMTELRHLLGLLSPAGTSGDEAPAAPGGTAFPARDLFPGGNAAAAATAATLSPQPGLGQLRSLIDPVAAAGLPVELHVTGEERGLPQGLDLTAFRVIQEALTNVIKHAGPARAEIRLDYRPAEIVVEIADDGTGGALGSTPGRGLLGLRERVALYGGDLDAGRRPAGGWLVRARIPA
jgi:signal transduction histidine kinase